MSLKWDDMDIETKVCNAIVVGLLLCFVALILFVGLWPSISHAQQTNLCRAPYFLTDPKYNYKAYKKTLEGVKSYSISILWNTPGNFYDNLIKELKDTHVNGVEVALVNETCLLANNGNRCGKYEVLYGLTMSKFKKQIDRANPVLKGKFQAQANIACNTINNNLPAGKSRHMSPLLETKLDRRRWQVVAGWVREVLACENYVFVWNPQGAAPGNPQSPALLAEGHGDSPRFITKAAIANNDGSYVADYEEYFRKYPSIEKVCGWHSNDNCINSGASGFIDPRKRDCRDTSGFYEIGEAMRQVEKPVEVPPDWDLDDDKSLVGCTKVHDSHDGAGGFIWKQSHVQSYFGTILFPAKYGRFSSVQIQSKGVKQGTVVYAKCTNPPCGFPDQADGNKLRPIWRTSRDIEKYPFNIVVRGASDSKINCWKIENPHIRND